MARRIIDGIKWYRYPKEGRHTASARYFTLGGDHLLERSRGEYYLHRYIWRRHHRWQEIPAGYDIHHKDGNTANNSIRNLVMVPAHEHARYHTINSRKQVVCGTCGKELVRHKWNPHKTHYCSQECQQKAHQDQRVCSCRKTFTTTKRSTRTLCDECFKVESGKQLAAYTRSGAQNGSLPYQKPLFASDGNYFPSQKLAAQHYGVSFKVVNAVLRGRRKSLPNGLTLRYAVAADQPAA